MSAPLSDFSDKLSPFLVKELRQSLRSGVFVVAMLWVQASMTLIVGIQVVLGGPQGPEDSMMMYWLNLALMMHGVLPLRDVIAGNEDLRAANFELLALTPGSDERLMMSKWLGTCVLILLCTVTVLPYHLVRYFAGGVDIVRESAALFFMAAAAAVYVLWAMYVSTFGPLVRTVLLVLMLIGILICDGFITGAVITANSEMCVTGVALYFIIGLISLGVTSGRFDYDFIKAGGVVPPEFPLSFPTRTAL